MKIEKIGTEKLVISEIESNDQFKEAIIGFCDPSLLAFVKDIHPVIRISAAKVWHDYALVAYTNQYGYKIEKVVAEAVFPTYVTQAEFDRA